MDFTSDSPPQSAQSALWLRSVLSGRSGTPCHQPPDVLSDNDIVRRQLSTSVSGVPLPCPDLAVLGVRPYGCPRLRSRISVCRSIASRFARASRRFVAAARLPPVPPAALRRRLLSLAPPSAAPRSARGGRVLSNASFFGSRAALSVVRCARV